MEKLFAYLQKIGVEERPQHGNYDEPPAMYNRVTYGDNSYFYNAPNHTHAAALVALDYNAEAPENYFANLRQIEQKIATYCKKYGYTATTTIHPWIVYIKIEKTSDREAAENYYYFRDAAREECEQYFHIAHTHGTPQKEIETTLRAIMDKYGENYKEFLQATA